MLVVIDYVDDGDDLLTLCDFSLYCILIYIIVYQVINYFLDFDVLIFVCLGLGL